MSIIPASPTVEPIRDSAGNIVWINTAKSILIYLVILGHFEFNDPTIHDYIYTFHVPAFLMITGYLISGKLSSMTWKEFFLEIIYPYALYYILFSFLSSVIFILGSIIIFGRINVNLQQIMNVLYASQVYGEYYFHKNTPLWYFAFLFSSLLIFNTFGRMKRPFMLFSYVAMLSVPFFADNAVLPWCLAGSGYGALFIVIGRWVRNGAYDSWLFSRFGGYSRFLLAIALAIILVSTASLNGNTNLNLLILGNNFALFVINAFIGTAAVAIISSMCSYNKIVNLISASTLYIFSFHIFFVKALNVLFDRIDIGGNVLPNFVGAIVVILGCTALSRLLSPPFERIVLARFLRSGRKRVGSSHLETV